MTLPEIFHGRVTEVNKGTYNIWELLHWMRDNGQTLIEPVGIRLHPDDFSMARRSEYAAFNEYGPVLFGVPMHSDTTVEFGRPHIEFREKR